VVNADGNVEIRKITINLNQGNTLQIAGGLSDKDQVIVYCLAMRNGHVNDDFSATYDYLASNDKPTNTGWLGKEPRVSDRQNVGFASATSGTDSQKEIPIV